MLIGQHILRDKYFTCLEFPSRSKQYFYFAFAISSFTSGKSFIDSLCLHLLRAISNAPGDSYVRIAQAQESFINFTFQGLRLSRPLNVSDWNTNKLLLKLTQENVFR